jgi:inner membrane protein
VRQDAYWLVARQGHGERLDNAFMPTALAHAVAALAIGACFYRPGVPRSLLLIGAVLASLPDLDVIGFELGVQYGDLLGHRGLTHSLAFAVALSAVAVWLRYPRGVGPMSARTAWAFLVLCTASHGILDAFTDDGLGTALLAPFDTTRYFWPVRPIAVAPIGFGGLMHPSMLRVIWTEIVWVCCPALMLGSFLFWTRRPGAERRREPETRAGRRARERRELGRP